MTREEIKNDLFVRKVATGVQRGLSTELGTAVRWEFRQDYPAVIYFYDVESDKMICNCAIYDLVFDKEFRERREKNDQSIS